MLVSLDLFSLLFNVLLWPDPKNAKNLLLPGVAIRQLNHPLTLLKITALTGALITGCMDLSAMLHWLL